MPTEGDGTKKYPDFSERLRIALEDRSAYSLSKSLNVSTSTAEKWLKGTSEPGLSNLCALAKSLGVSIQWLATGEGPMRTHPRPASTSGSVAGLLDVSLLARLTDGIVQVYRDLGREFPIPKAVEEAVLLHDEIAAAIEPQDVSGRTGAMLYALSRLRTNLRAREKERPDDAGSFTGDLYR